MSSGALDRRAVLRLAGLAAGAVVAGACGSNGTPAEPGPWDEGRPGDGGSPAGGSARIEDLVLGRWKLSAGGASCVLTVDAATWRLSAFTAGPGGDGGPLARTLHGTYKLTAGVLEVQVFDSADDTDAERGVGQPVPAQVAPTDAATVQWSYGTEQPSPVPVRREGDQLVVTYQNHDGPLVITAQRT